MNNRKPERLHWSKHWVLAATKFEHSLPPGSRLRREFQEAAVRAKMKDDAQELGRFFDCVAANKKPELEHAIARALKSRPHPFL